MYTYAYRFSYAGCRDRRIGRKAGGLTHLDGPRGPLLKISTDILYKNRPFSRFFKKLPFFNVFQPMWILGRTLKFSAPCLEVWSSRKSLGWVYLSRDSGNQGLGGDGPGAFSRSDSGFDHFFGHFWIRCHHADPPGVRSNLENGGF